MTTCKTKMFQSLKSKRKFKSRENKQDTILRVKKLLDMNAKLRKIWELDWNEQWHTGYKNDISWCVPVPIHRKLLTLRTKSTKFVALTADDIGENISTVQEIRILFLRILFKKERRIWYLILIYIIWFHQKEAKENIGSESGKLSQPSCFKFLLWLT